MPRFHRNRRYSRRRQRSSPILIAGSDLICSGMGSILKYDNSFNPSLINGEGVGKDYLVLQRDFRGPIGRG